MEDPASSSSPSSSSILSIWTSMNSWFTPAVLFVLLNLMIGTILFTSNLPNHHHNHLEKEKEKEKSHQNQNDPNQPILARSHSILHRLKSLNFYPHRSQQDLSPATHHHHFDQHHHQHQEEQEGLEVAATQYVFNQHIPLEQDVEPPTAQATNHFDFNPTRFDHEVAAAVQYDVFNQTHELQLPNAETHFVFEQQQAAETVTTHFDSDLTLQENTGFEEETEGLQSLDEVYSRLTGRHVNRTKSDTQPASGEVPPKLPAKMKKSASLKSAFSHFEEEKIVEARRPATVRERKSAARVTEEDDVEVDTKADDFINKFKHQLKLQRIDSIIRYKDMVNRGGAK